MSLPETLTNIAALGTDKYANGGGALPLPDGSVSRTLAGRADLSPEGKLLLTAAGLAMQARAGWTPPQDRRPAPEPFDGDQRPMCSKGAASHLRMMLEGDQPEALPEWLAQLAQRGQRPPEETLPALLEIGKKDKALRPLIAAAVGAHGRWLAQLATTRGWRWLVLWDGLSPERAANLWEKGAKEERIELLETLRRTDPETARALVAASWKEERAPERRAFLDTFAVGLRMADEPFLDAALNDRSNEVQQRAAELLAYLPESRYVGRMSARAMELCTVKKKLLGKQTLTFTLPEATPELQCDGLPLAQSGVHGLGKGALLLYQILVRVPPAYWCQQLGVSRADLIERFKQSDELPRPLDILAWATYHARDTELAALLVTEKMAQFQENVAPLLLPILPPETAERVVQHVAEANAKTALSIQHPLLKLLNEYSRPWNEAITRAFLSSTRLYLAKETANLDYQLIPLLKRYALYMPTAHAPTIIDALTAERKNQLMVAHWSGVLNAVQAILDFRRDMIAAF